MEVQKEGTVRSVENLSSRKPPLRVTEKPTPAVPVEPPRIYSDSWWFEMWPQVSPPHVQPITIPTRLALALDSSDPQTTHTFWNYLKLSKVTK